MNIKVVNQFKTFQFLSQIKLILFRINRQDLPLLLSAAFFTVFYSRKPFEM